MLGVGAETVDRESDRVQAGHHRGQPRPTCGMPVFVPPAVFEKVQTVFDLPVPAYIAQQIVGSHLIGIEAGDKVADVVRDYRAACSAQFAVHAQGNAATGEAQCLANVVGVL